MTDKKKTPLLLQDYFGIIVAPCAKQVSYRCWAYGLAGVFWCTLPTGRGNTRRLCYDAYNYQMRKKKEVKIHTKLDNTCNAAIDRRQTVPSASNSCSMQQWTRRPAR